jgi:putative lipase involved disintegration of autophagic bodies
METVLILKLFYPDSTIVISGDSLGAAISTHALVHLVWVKNI